MRSAEAVACLWPETNQPGREGGLKEHICMYRRCSGGADLARLAAFLATHAEDHIPAEARSRLEVCVINLDTN